MGKELLADQITRCLNNKDIHQAMAISQRLNHEYPDYAYGWYLASFLMKKVQRHAEALTAINQALQLFYSDKYQLQKIKCLFEAGDTAAAINAIGIIKDKSFTDPQLHSQVGSLLHMLGDNVTALIHYSRAIDLDPRNAEFYFNQAAVKRYLGDVAGAEAGFDAAIALKPDEFEAYSGRSQLRTQTSERNHIAQLQEIVGRTRSAAGLVQLHYALAKEQEDIGDYESAFANLKLGADTKRQHMNYRVDTDLQIIAKIQETYRPELFDGRIVGCDRDDPIFIIGMPRTGTTLVERILGSHSLVHAAGELNTFALELMRLVKEAPSPAPASRADFVARTAQLDFKALGEAYLSAARPVRGTTPHFIDKLPFNYLYAGLIHLALPRAKIINVQRHPMDTCFAVYKQWFKDAYPFSYNLDELGKYYLAYHQLMQHWNEVMPGVIHTLQYESLVADIDGETRRLLHYCELPWEEQCLRYYQNTQASTTASALQVRQPVYHTSVGKWRHYARQLESLRAQLERAGITIEPIN